MGLYRSKHRRLVWTGAVVLALAVASVLTLPITLPGTLRARLSDALSERFDSQVSINALHVSVFPRLRVTGEQIELRHKGRTDVPPLVRIASFSAEAHLLGVLFRPVRLQHVALQGLEVNVPPGGLHMGDQSAGRKDRDRARAPDAADVKEPPPSDLSASRSDAAKPPLVVEDLLSERAVLRILRRDPGKPPRVFQIHHLSMQDVGSYQPWAFSTTITNPTPPGRVDARGTFGPWNATEPSRTPLQADYTFAEAKLGVFKGIKGVLQSSGQFGGVLERIEVDGRADVPDFALDQVGQPAKLTTTFRSIVDGTSGDTWLKPVEAVLARTVIHASGGVVEREGDEGRTVALDVIIDEGRIEDVLKLALKAAQPPMRGGLKLKTKLLLPPGGEDAMQKLDLDGSFEIATARFTGPGVQQKINEMSRRARGELDERAENIVSDMKGRFKMHRGTIHFSNVSFAIPGARVDVAGTYVLRSEALDFKGTVRLAAKLSQLTTGAKSVLLRVADPLFRRKNATVVPITIGGTAAKPKFGLDVKRALTLR